MAYRHKGADQIGHLVCGNWFRKTLTLLRKKIANSKTLNRAVIGLFAAYLRFAHKTTRWQGGLWVSNGGVFVKESQPCGIAPSHKADPRGGLDWSGG